MFFCCHAVVSIIFSLFHEVCFCYSENSILKLVFFRFDPQTSINVCSKCKIWIDSEKPKSFRFNYNLHFFLNLLEWFSLKRSWVWINWFDYWIEFKPKSNVANLGRGEYLFILKTETKKCHLTVFRFSRGFQSFSLRRWSQSSLQSSRNILVKLYTHLTISTLCENSTKLFVHRMKRWENKCRKISQKKTIFYHRKHLSRGHVNIIFLSGRKIAKKIFIDCERKYQIEERIKFIIIYFLPLISHRAWWIFPSSLGFPFPRRCSIQKGQEHFFFQNEL